jgi:hypothetical protein
MLNCQILEARFDDAAFLIEVETRIVTDEEQGQSDLSDVDV